MSDQPSIEEDFERAKQLIAEIWGAMFKRNIEGISDADTLKKIEDLLSKEMRIT